MGSSGVPGLPGQHMANTVLCHANRVGSTGQFVMQMEDRFKKNGNTDIRLCFKDKHRYVFCDVRQRQLRKSTIEVGIFTQLTFQKNKKI